MADRGAAGGGGVVTVVSRRFLNIRSDASFSGFLDASTVDGVLMAFSGVSRGEDWPYVLDGGVILFLPVRCDSRGNYSLRKGEQVPLVNLLELACPDDDAWSPLCEEVADRLAAALGWSWCWDDGEDAPPGQMA